MKTPEEMATEHAEEKGRVYYYYGSDGQLQHQYGRGSFSYFDFLAGYEAAMSQVENKAEKNCYTEHELLCAFQAGSKSGNGVMPGLRGYIPEDFQEFLQTLKMSNAVKEEK